MKVTVKEKSETKEYPWIGISNNETIVLFDSLKEGLCLRPGNFSPRFTGEYYIDWIEKDFQPFEGEIVLRNS